MDDDDLIARQADLQRDAARAIRELGLACLCEAQPLVPSDLLPFAGQSVATLVLPETDPTLSGRRELLELERAAFEAELGAPVEFATTDPGAGPRWRFELDQQDGAPSTSWDVGKGLIRSRARDVDGLLEALNLWRTVRRRGGGSLEATDCTDRVEAVERVVDEIADTYPAFELRGLDWPSLCARHVEAVLESNDLLAALQTWVAELEDSHTWVWPGHGNLPYVVCVQAGSATFAHVPRDTAGHAAGVRPGWRLTAVDDEEVDPDAWWTRTAAPPHSHPFLAGRRLLAGPAGTRRTLTAVAPSGRRATWEDEPTTVPTAPTVTWNLLSRRIGYLRVEAWLEGRGVDDAIDAALAEFRACEELIVDLRRNPGGSLVLASRTRDRFLREQTTMGSIRYSVGRGRLSPAVSLTAEPSSAASRWRGRLIVLTDELTFSSSEDFLLGLQGLEHVTVVGRPSGGGSGRPRSVRLLPGWRLTVSTALTYDRDGRCIEGAGVPVDVHVARDSRDDVDSMLVAAETL